MKNIIIVCGVSAWPAGAIALANSTDVLLALPNAAMEMDDDGWALVAPFGRWPKTYRFTEGGQAREKNFIQVLDNESADAMLAKENSFFSKLKRAIVGVPVYKGHGDVKDVDPKAIANTAEKQKVGVVDQIRKSSRGIEAHFALDNDGADAVRAGWKFPSAYWWVIPTGAALANGDIEAKPFKLISVALTQFPNISGVESLANARTNEPAARTETQNNTQDTMKQLLIGWLAAQGIALSNDSTDQAVFDAWNKEMQNRSSASVALSNERTTALQNVNTLTADRDAQKKRADDSVAALANEQTTRKAERKARATHAVDLVIQKGKLTVAQRDEKITALENAGDFDAEYKKLDEAAAVVKTAADALTGKQNAALENEEATVTKEYNTAMANEMKEGGCTMSQAHQRVMTLPKYSGLAAKLAPKAAANK